MEKVFELIIQLFLDDGVIIAVGVYVLGEIIKKAIPAIKNDFIPLIGGIVGIALGLTIPNIFVGADIITKAIYGLALGWAATGGYETVTRLFNKEEN